MRASLPEVLADRATTALTALGDPPAASSMAACMKTEMPFHGVKKAARTRILQDLVDEFSIATHGQYVATVRGLWSQPNREEKYLAVAWGTSCSPTAMPGQGSRSARPPGTSTSDRRCRRDVVPRANS